jgi:hypothetical protein
MTMPAITTAIPKRRYQLGEFSLVVLGDIDSKDGRQYRYLLAVIPAGGQHPELFLSAEKQSGNLYLMRLMAAQASQELETSPYWHDLETFCADGVNVLKKILSLEDEEAIPL